MKNAIAALVRKKTLFALVLALTIFGAVYGFAATLNVGNGQLSAGNATVASCQSTTPATSYTVVAKSKSGGLFSITRTDSAPFTRTCSGGTKGCVNSTW